MTAAQLLAARADLCEALKAAFAIGCAEIALDGKRLTAAELAILFGCKTRMIQHYKAGTEPILQIVLDHLANTLQHGLLPEVATAIRERRSKDGRKR